MSPATARSLPGPARTEVLRRAVEQALRAPSTRNSQPWKWRVGAGAVELYADGARHVSALDPDRRDLVISCGAALHHLRVALAGSGCGTRTLLLPDPGDPAHLATVQVVAEPADPDDASLLPLIQRRRTDRRRFGPRPVRTAQLDLLREHAAACGAGLHPVAGGSARAGLDAALAEAASRPRHTIGFSDELIVCAQDVPDAAAAKDAPPGPRRICPDDGGRLLMITTSADGIADRLRAGAAASSVLLAATRLGLASTLLSRAAQAPHPPGGDACTPGQPQLMIRVGWPREGAAPLPATPRRLLSSVLLPT